MRRPIHLSAQSAVLLALFACACGSDDNKTQAPVDDNDGGAAPVAPSYPPAIGPENCATATSKIKLSQPDGAAVWGGLVLLEFTVDGAAGTKLDSFDVQELDPQLGAWTSAYVGAQSIGQRDDGSYFVAVSPYFSDGNKDQELKLRIRPSQQGCPDADWTETDTFTAGDPLVGTKWQADLPAALFAGQLTVQRTPLPEGAVLDPLPLTAGDATMSVEFGKKGVLTEIVTVPLSSKKGAAYNGCSLGLTFSGTYSLTLPDQYSNLLLAISDQTLTDFSATTCDLPAVDDMAIAAKNAVFRLPAYTLNVSIDYLPTLYLKPGAPRWFNSNFTQLFPQLTQFLTYTSSNEFGSVNGNLYPQDPIFKKQ